jgi:predicted nucleic acid-binding protein
VRRRAARVRESASRGVIVDASMAVPWFAPEVGSETATRLLDGGFRLTAPDLMAAEAANAWWKKVGRGFLAPADVVEAVRRLFAVGVEWIPTAPLVPRATRLALEVHHPVYDCIYIVLARELGLPLATSDERLRRAARATETLLLPVKGRS